MWTWKDWHGLSELPLLSSHNASTSNSRVCAVSAYFIDGLLLLKFRVSDSDRTLKLFA